MNGCEHKLMGSYIVNDKFLFLVRLCQCTLSYITGQSDQYTLNCMQKLIALSIVYFV